MEKPEPTLVDLLKAQLDAARAKVALVETQFQLLQASHPQLKKEVERLEAEIVKEEQIEKEESGEIPESRKRA